MNQRDFILLWTQHSRRVFAFIFTLLPHWADAEEVLQETAALLWDKFAEYQPGTNFRAWACRIAYYKVLEYRRARKRNVLAFSDGLIDALDRTFEHEAEALQGRAAALAGCLERLSSKDRELIRLRYQPGAAVRDVAAEVRRSADAVYKALQRIHDALFDCVQRTMAAEGSP